MPTPTIAKLKFRGKEYPAQILDADAFFFFALALNDRERRIARDGDWDKAYDSINARIQQTSLRIAQERGISYRKATNIVGGQLALRIYQRAEESDTQRRTVAQRLKEICPELPDNLIYYRGEADFGIRLSLEELTYLYTQILLAALSEAKKKKEEKSAASDPLEYFDELAEEDLDALGEEEGDGDEFDEDGEIILVDNTPPVPPRQAAGRRSQRRAAARGFGRS